MASPDRGQNSAKPTPIGYVQLLRENRAFRALWLAEVVSFLGDWFNTVAIYAIIEQLSGSGRAFAGVMVAKTLPVFFVTPIFGPIVDRFDRRTLMIVSDVVRAVLAVGLVFASRFESVPALYVIMVLMMVAAGLFVPSQRAALPQIAPGPQLAPANALSGGTWSVMLALGAAAGGWVTAQFGTETALILDAGTFLLSAGFLVLLPKLPAPGASQDATDPDGKKPDRSFVGGIRYLANHHRIAVLAMLKPMMAFAGAAIMLIPVIAARSFPEAGGPGLVGALYSARGLGALVGSIALIRLFGDDSRTLRRLVLAGFPVAGLSYWFLGDAPTPLLACVCYFTAAIASGANWVNSTTLLQRDGDPTVLGRVFAVEFGLVTLIFALVAWVGGSALDLWGWSSAVIAKVSGAMLVIPFSLWLVHLLVERRRNEEGRRVAPASLGQGPNPDLFEESQPEEEPR